ncbi:MAG: VWA domain-containing protein [Bryobacterales bacterium]|nr:VWA domain-containing protein [Bryobacterales bacterium]
MAISKRKRRQRGVILIMLTLVLMVILPMAGLAFDVGLLYLIRTKLSAALDAAVLAGARSLSRGMDLASQIESARQTATQYFRANFPEGLYGTSNLTFSATVQETGYRTRTVSGVASVTAPLYFLRLLGQNTATMSARATASRRDVNLILVLDRSGSIEQGGATTAVKNSAISFVSKFAEGRDRVGLVSFSGNYRIDFAPSMTFKTSNPSIMDRINSLVMSGNTGYAEALWRAYELLRNINEPGALNVIVFFTDGRPTALSASFPVKTVADQRYGDGQSPYTNTNTLYNMPASSCTSSANKVGFMAVLFSGNTPRWTAAVMRDDSTSPSMAEDTLSTSNTSGCAFAAGAGWSFRMRALRDIAYVPDTDRHGNSTWGYKRFTTPEHLFPPGHPYAGRIRPDRWEAVRHAAYNLADNIAARIRNDTLLSPVIFSIALGGMPPAEPIDDELLRRVANDRNSPIFDPNRPAGLYVYAPTPAELDQAFLRVASEILRLAE